MGNIDKGPDLMTFTVPTGEIDIKQLITWHLMIMVINMKETSLSTPAEDLGV